MTDEQIIAHYEHQARCEAKRVERYWTDPDYREKRRKQNTEAARRYRQRQRRG